MKKNHMACYICDNEFFFLNEDGKIHHETFESLHQEEIINSSLFKEELENFLKKYRIKLSLFGKTISFLKHSELSNLSMEKYEEIFHDYFRRIEFRDIKDLFKINNETGTLLVTDSYLDYYYMKKNKKEYLRIPFKLFNENKRKIFQHIFSMIYKPKKLLILGPNENMNTIADEINKQFNIQVTFPENYYTYIFEEYKK